MTALTIDPATQDVTIYVNENAPGTVSPDNPTTLTNKGIALGSNTITGTKAQFNTALTDGDFATQAGTETLTNKSISMTTNTITGTFAQFNTACTDADFATLTGAQTLTQKTISMTSNTITGTFAEFNTACTDADFTTLTGAQTLTNKGIALGTNTVSGTIAEFNGACSDADFATISGTETLTNKTLSSAALGTPASGNLTNCTADGTNILGFLTIPQNSQSAAYTLVLADAGKHILHPSADTTARVFTIPSNASVAFPVGTAITFINQNAGGVITITITTDTMRMAVSGSTADRTLAANGIATAIKVTSTEWFISGSGLT